jgi:hypothetical protein
MTNPILPFKVINTRYQQLTTDRSFTIEAIKNTTPDKGN